MHTFSIRLQRKMLRRRAAVQHNLKHRLNSDGWEIKG